MDNHEAAGVSQNAVILVVLVYIIEEVYIWAVAQTFSKAFNVDITILSTPVPVSWRWKL